MTSFMSGVDRNQGTMFPAQLEVIRFLQPKNEPPNWRPPLPAQS
jgi:hypothetical protein